MKNFGNGRYWVDAKESNAFNKSIHLKSAVILKNSKTEEKTRTTGSFKISNWDILNLDLDLLMVGFKCLFFQNEIR